MWIAGTTMGQGHSQPYGRFYDSVQERMVLAHRWSAEHIHGFDVTNLQVDHCCPAGPSTLCVHHVKPETAERNRHLQAVRPGRGWQDLETRRHWIHVQVGIVEIPERKRIIDDAPFFLPPVWLAPFMPVVEVSDDCPF